MKGTRISALLAGAAVFAAGFVAAVFLHYGLHRLLLTIEPFIYISF